MVELTMAMEQERDKLEKSKAAAAGAATCPKCKEQPTAKDSTGAPPNRTLGDGQYSVVSKEGVAGLRYFPTTKDKTVHYAEEMSDALAEILFRPRTLPV